MTTREEIAELIGQLHGSEAEDAECTLTGMPETLPLVIAAYEGEPDAERRTALLHCLWEYRNHAAVPTLQRALLEADDRVWKEALDGLVALGGERAEQALHEAREELLGQGGGAAKRKWFDEAMEQIVERNLSGRGHR